MAIIQHWLKPKKRDKPFIVKTFRVGYSVVKVMSDDTIWEYCIDDTVPMNLKKWRELV